MTKERALTILRQYLAQAENEEAWLAEHSMPGEDIRSASEDAEAFRMAIAAWEEQEWVPVTERLPKDGCYLCTIDGELCGESEPFTGMCGIEKGVWDEPDMVSAWMPMPEPYEEA